MMDDSGVLMLSRSQPDPITERLAGVEALDLAYLSPDRMGEGLAQCSDIDEQTHSLHFFGGKIDGGLGGYRLFRDAAD
jgi:hypothetical protein